MLSNPVTRIGKNGLRWVENTGLIVIAIATVIAGAQEIDLMIPSTVPCSSPICCCCSSTSKC